MHHALEIYEILLNIFGHCYSPYVESTTGRELVSLARTCRAFTEPALDILWEELVDLSPLARCLPEVVRAPYRGNKYSFSRPLTQTEWIILRRYTRRIRFVWDFKGGLDKKSLAILSSSPATEPLFPGLRYLCCKYTTKATHMLHLHFPSLVSLHVCCEDPHSFQVFLESFPDSCPNIKTLRLNVHLHDDVFDFQFVTNCICRWRDLRAVVCPGIAFGVDALAHLSRVSTLTRLDFALNATLPIPNSPLLFSNLQDLTLHSKSLNTITRLLSQTRLPYIMNFAVVIHRCPSGRELSSFVDSVQITKAKHTIESFTLTQSSGSRQRNFLRSEAPILALEDLWPYTVFSNIRNIDLNISWNVGLTDNDLLMVTSAWPHLESLCINEDWGWNRIGITPNGLVQLLHTRRSLRRIALAIHTRRYTEFLPLPDGWTSRGLSINVLDSAIEPRSMVAFAAFFAAISLYAYFPFRAWDSSIAMTSLLREVYHDRWWQVYRQAWRP